MTKNFGGKKSIAGKKVIGTHSSVIEGVPKILDKFAAQSWFVSVRAGEITTGKKVGGGAPFVSVKRHQNTQQKNTLTLTFKRSGVIQKIYVQADDLEKNLSIIIESMREIVGRAWKGAELVERI